MLSNRLKFLCVLVCAFFAYAKPANTQATDLYISEYIEGSSNNKAIEIYNPTGSPVTLSGMYRVQMFFNGALTSGLTINLTGTIAPGDVFVVTNSGANEFVRSQADQITTQTNWYNGDDAVVLQRLTAPSTFTPVDSIGQIGFDPGTQWGAGDVSTADNTLRRKATVTAGDPIATDEFDPAAEWDGFDTDTFNGLGAHLNEPVQAVCGAQLIVALGSGGSRVVTASDADGTVSNFSLGTISGIFPPGSITLSNITPAIVEGGTASATVNVASSMPTGTFNVPVTAVNDDLPAQQAQCTLSVNVVAVTTREIFEIQGSDAASPFSNQVVRTADNIVTAVSVDGFFIQTPDARADEDAQTSNGVFVFTGSAPPVAVGQQVDVIGRVAEFFDWTELTSPSVQIDSSGNALPAAVPFAPSRDPIPNEMERFENMRVRVENGVATAPTDRFGDTAIVAGSSRAFREPGIEFPGDPAHPVIWDGNPEIFEIDPNGAGLPPVNIAAGTTIALAEGPLAFVFGDYQVWPTALTLGEAPALPRPVRARNAGELTVASQNLQRFFDNDRTNGPDDGEANAAMFPDKVIKTSLHIRTVLGAPDVVFVEEVENLGVVQAVAERLNADDATLNYTAYLLEGHDVGGIDTGVLVRDTVSATSVTQLGFDSLFTVDNPPSFLHDRPPLVVQGEYVANGAPFAFTAIGVHNRSLTDVDTSTRVRQKRLEQALEIAEYVQSIQTSEPGRRLIVTGDFNAFQFSDGYVDAMGVITGNLDPNGAIHPGHADVVDPNLVDQIDTLPESERYSFIFEGSSQVLDHTLTTSNLSPYLRGLQLARGNADAPEAFRASTATPLRLADHDGEVLFVMTDRDADSFPDDVDACPASAKTVVTVGTCTTTVPDQIFSNGCSITDTLARMAASAPNHGQFVSDAAHFLTELRQAGAIDNKQRGEIVSCSARSR